MQDKDVEIYIYVSYQFIYLFFNSVILANEQHSLKNCRRVSLIPSVLKSIIDRILESEFILARIFVAELVKN